MDLIRCPRCAKEVPGSSQFCRRCGYTIAWNIATAPAAVPAAAPVVRPVPPQPRPARRTAPPTPSRPRKGGIIGVLAIVAAVFFFSFATNVTRRVSTPSMPAVRFPTYNPPIYNSQPVYGSPTYRVPESDGRSSTVIRSSPFIPLPQGQPPIIINEQHRPWDASSRTRNTYPNQHSNEQHSSERSSRQR